MKLRIKETQEIKTLEMKDKNKIEWTEDLLGNYDSLHFNEETEEYEMNLNDYEWWSEYIENRKADAEEVMKLAEKLGIEPSEIWEKINKELNCDLGCEHAIIQNVLREIRKE